MLLLTSTSDLIELVTATGVANIYAYTTWMEFNTTTGAFVTSGRTNTAAISTGATTTIVAASGSSSNTRKVKFMSVRNTHASSSCVITFRHYDGTTHNELYQHILLAGEQVHFVEGVGFYVLDLTAGIVGRYVGATSITGVTTSFTTGPSTHTIRLTMIGGGGGGGGSTGNTVNGTAGGGGASGGYAEKTLTVTPSTTYTCQVGAGGAGGINGANNGNQGTNSFFVVGSTNVIANGGPGGAGGINGAVPRILAGGVLPTASSNTDLSGTGVVGGAGIAYAATIWKSGDGAAGAFGGGAVGTVTSADGAAGLANTGSGGSGSATNVNATNHTGGAGGSGIILVEEFS